MIALSISVSAMLVSTWLGALSSASARQVPPAALDFIDTGIENGSPLWYEIVDNVVRINLLYDHERSSPNRAAGHVHFVLHASPGASLTLEFRNLDNVWNGQPGSVAGELKTVAISEDGRAWRTVPTDSLPGNRVQLRVTMTGPRLHVARMEPYRLSDLDRLLETIRSHRLVRIEPIGQTAGGRAARDRSHWRSGRARIACSSARGHIPGKPAATGSRTGSIERLLTRDEETRRFLRVYNVSVLPMANKDGVARGGTRFNLRGKDLNRNWDKPADPELSPENAALERWLEREIAANRQAAPRTGAAQRRQRAAARQPAARPGARSAPRAHDDARDVAAPAHLVHRRHDGPTFRNSGTLGEGWLQRYGIDAAVHEFNCNWIEGLKQPSSSTHWRAYGAGLARVFHDYFEAVKP